MIKKRKNIITVAIDSPAAAGAGTQAKYIAKEFKLLYLDTGKIYRLIGKMRIDNKKKFNLNLVRKKIGKIKLVDLNKKNLLSDKVAISAAIVAKDRKIRQMVKQFQLNCAYRPPSNFSGSVLDGRDITSVIMKDAMFKFYITASLKVRARRRYYEYRELKKKISYKDVLKSLKKRDYLDKNRRHSPLKKTKDSILINTSKLSKKACFYKIKAIMEKKININGNF
jgi:cytidylate kinase